MDTNIPEKLEALEEEKEEYLENNPDESSEDSENEGMEEVEEDVEVDETEFSLSEDEIYEWIVKLTELKVERNPIELEVDEETTLKINFDKNEDEE